MSLEPISFKVPIFFLSVKVIRLRQSWSFQPEVLYSTERVLCLKRGYPFLPGTFFLQLSKKRLTALSTLSTAV